MKDAPRMQEQAERERYEALAQIEDWLETPVLILGIAWLILLVVELIWGLNPFLNALVYFIWGVFVLDFAIRFVLAPRKLNYLRRNWLTALSLFIPALRIGRLTRIAALTRATRGLRLVKVVASLNRGMATLRATLDRRGFGYVMLLTLLVTLVGAAGMLAFERPVSVPAGQGDAAGQGLNTYGESLWWTAMIMTTLGSEYWPQSAEGRLLTLLLSVYAFAVFGYVTATLATFFIGTDAAQAQAQPAPQERRSSPPEGMPVTGQPVGQDAQDQDLRAEIQALRAEIENLRNLLQDQTKS